MARKARKNTPLLEGAYYHVYSRFSSRRFRLAESAAKEKFLILMRYFCNRYGVVIHGYCLMSNHFHMLCSIQQGGDISRAFAKIKEMFSKWHHEQTHEKIEDDTSDGGLWKDRFSISLVENDRYALTLLRYIDNNPVRAGMVSAPWDYEYSSCVYYALGTRRQGVVPLPSWMALAQTPQNRIRIYHDSLLSNISKFESSPSNRPWFSSSVIGSENFIEDCLRCERENRLKRMRLKKQLLDQSGGLFFSGGG